MVLKTGAPEALYHDDAFVDFYDLENGWGVDTRFCAKLARSAAAVLDIGCGTGLLAAYAFGLGVPFLLTALFADRASRWLGRLRGAGAALQIVGGAILVVLGAAMLTGQLGRFSVWLLDAVPALGRLG